MITIRNKKTGEIRQINEADVGQYFPQTQPQITGGDGISPDMANAYIQQLILQGLSAPGTVAGGRALTQAAALKDLLGVGETTEQKNANKIKSDAETALKELEDIFFFNKRGPLAYGTGTSDFGRLSARIEGIKATQIAGYNEELNRYQRQWSTLGPKLAKLAGDTGNIALQEQIKALGGLAQGIDTFETAVEMVNETRRKFGLPERDIVGELQSKGINEIKKGDGTVIPLNIKTEKKTETQKPSGPQYPGLTFDQYEKPQIEQRQAGPTDEFLQKKTLPIIGAILGGLGGIPIGQPGLGAAAGYGGGDVIRRGLADLTGANINEGTIMAPKGTPQSTATGLISGPLTSYGLGSLLGPMAVAPFKHQLASRVAGTASTAPIKAGVSEFAKDLPSSSGAEKALLEKIPNEVDAKKLTKLLEIWGNAFTNKGGVKSPALAKLMSQAYGPGRQLLTQMAPEVGLSLTGRARNYALSNLLGRFVSPLPYILTGYAMSRGVNNIGE